jgi:hypothetical protein
MQITWWDTSYLEERVADCVLDPEAPAYRAGV